MMKPKERQAWLLAHMREENVDQCGWDWEADERYARAVGADPEIIELMQAVIRADGGTTYHRLRAAKLSRWRLVTRARHRDLRALTAAGWLTASWAGISDTGGATRTRTWTLNRQHPDFATPR